MAVVGEKICRLSGIMRSPNDVMDNRRGPRSGLRFHSFVQVFGCGQNSDLFGVNLLRTPAVRVPAGASDATDS